jgi:hypothetical protein
MNNLLIKHKKLLQKYDNKDINELDDIFLDLYNEIKNKKKIYDIEKIIKKKNTKNGMKYYVKWKGYSDNHNSWITQDNFC